MQNGKSYSFVLSYVEYGNCEAIRIRFDVVQDRILRATKEYDLVYVPEIDEWFGDVIAYGQWRDLEADEVLQLREIYNLDALMQDYLERGEDQVTYDYYAAAK